ncbi:hypothetical protein DFH09DRAFT_1293030 [Mycena vulgaris]|nr:hypothetical protein DFH09DRAFT_1293030 [Mycena vulgaris]
MASYETRRALSARRFERLSSILSEANTHHAAVAAVARAAAAPTYHARTRAQKLGLAVDTVRAVACDARLVSYIPLPIIETGLSPPAPTPAPRGRPTLRLIVPRAPADVPVSGGSYSMLSMSTGSVPAAAAPTVLRGPTSRFSLTPDDPIFTMVPRRAPAPPAAAPVIPDVPFDEEDFTTEWELAYPASGAADYAASSTSTYASSSTSGSSSGSSSGPATPADADPIPVPTMSAKRKSEDDYAAGEKRPKYERKSWARGRTLC